MTAKMKGLLKGLRYISQIFDEEKEAEIQIGLPTDVKHVAHIGFEGSQSVENPSWMKEFKGSTGVAGDSKDNPDTKWASEDSNRRGTRTDGNPEKDPDLPKSSRRHSSSDNPDSPKSKNRQSRRNRPKEASEGSVKSRDCDGSGELPDIPKKSRRKKSKDCDGSTRSSTRSSRRAAAALESGQDPEASVRSVYSDAGDGSTRSSKRGSAAAESGSDGAGAW